MYRLETVMRRVFVPMTVSFDEHRVLRLLAHGEGRDRIRFVSRGPKGSAPVRRVRSDPGHRMTTGSAAIVFDAEPLSRALYNISLMYINMIFSGGPCSRLSFERSQVRSAASGRVERSSNNCTSVI